MTFPRKRPGAREAQLDSPGGDAKADGEIVVRLPPASTETVVAGQHATGILGVPRAKLLETTRAERRADVPAETPEREPHADVPAETPLASAGSSRSAYA